jgi:uncharacterized protein
MASTILNALGLVLVIEGLTYVLVPRQLKRMLVHLQEMSEDQLRVMGTVALAIGVAVVWIARILFKV